MALGLANCGEGRFVGFDKCAQDGSIVWYERPNSQGNYDGLDVNAANCK
ncbi:MAG: hypothetical protein RIB84_03510 [Sneathiellaceae bacterium]